MTEPPRRAPGPTVRTSAPVRLDFAGGWTDVPPFVEREGGLVVNAAIDLRVEVEFEPGGQGLLLQSEDLRQAARIQKLFVPTTSHPERRFELLRVT